MARTGAWALPVPSRPGRRGRRLARWRALTADALLWPQPRPRRTGRAPVGAGDQRRAQRGRGAPRPDGPPHPLRRGAPRLLLRPALLRGRRSLPHRRAVRRLRLLPPAGRRPPYRRLAAARPGDLLPGAAPGRAHRRPARRPPGGRRPADHGQALRQQRGGFSLAFLLNGATLLAYLRAYLRPAGRPASRPGRCLFSLLAGVLCWVWQPALALLPVLVPLLLWRQPSLRHPLRLLLALAPWPSVSPRPWPTTWPEGWPSVTQLARKYSSPLGWEAAPGIGRGPGAIGRCC